VDVDPATGARSALVYALYHPAAALRSTEVERQSFADVAGIPAALTEARRRRAEAVARPATDDGAGPIHDSADDAADARLAPEPPPTLF
jgi:hypothetical protein